MKKQNKSFYQKGGGDSDGAVVLVCFALFVWFVLWLCGFNYHGTSQGSVDDSDCRETITLQPNDWRTYFGTYVGYAEKTQSGKIMSGTFVRIVNGGSLFGSDNTCETAYTYNLPQDPTCLGNIKNGVSYPYLGYDDLCYTTPQGGEDYISK